MEAGGELETLAGVADRLCAEFGYRAVQGRDGDPPPSELTSARLFGVSLGEEEERLVATARQALVRIAEALMGRKPAAIPETAVPALIDGAEMVMRSELAAGNPPTTLMPSFVFLVTLPLVDQDEALELSRRTASILEEASG
jgi:hypothetical protein